MFKKNSELKTKVYQMVSKIPKGKVAYFGQIARIVGTNARTVGWILSGMNQKDYNLIPWQRVVAVDGFISSLKLGEKGLLQKQMLLEEGYEIISDKVNMQIFGMRDEDF